MIPKMILRADTLRIRMRCISNDRERDKTKSKRKTADVGRARGQKKRNADMTIIG